MHASSQVTNALHAVSVAQVPPAIVTQAVGVAIVSCPIRHVLQADDGVPLGRGRGAVAVAGRGPPHSRSR